MESTKRQSGFKLPIVSAVDLTKAAVDASYFLKVIFSKKMHFMFEKLYLLCISIHTDRCNLSANCIIVHKVCKLSLFRCPWHKNRQILNCHLCFNNVLPSLFNNEPSQIEKETNKEKTLQFLGLV